MICIFVWNNILGRGRLSDRSARRGRCSTVSIKISIRRWQPPLPPPPRLTPAPQRRETRRREKKILPAATRYIAHHRRGLNAKSTGEKSGILMFFFSPPPCEKPLIDPMISHRWIKLLPRWTRGGETWGCCNGACLTVEDLKIFKIFLRIVCHKQCIMRYISPPISLFLSKYFLFKKFPPSLRVSFLFFSLFYIIIFSSFRPCNSINFEQEISLG